MKTKVKKPEEIERAWYLVNAQGLTLGRMCSKIARVLIGKHKPTYTPHIDSGDFVVVINADKFKLTGRKFTNKIYYSHSGYPGGLKALSLEKIYQRAPERIIYHAVSGMLPKNRLRIKRLKRLKIFCTETHPYTHISIQKLNI